MIHVGELLVFVVEQRAARHNPESRRLAPRGNPPRGFTLNNHCADEDAVGPRQIFLGEFMHIGIREPHLPFRRKHSRNGQQSQRWKRRALSDKLERMFKTPERVREFGID